MTGFHSLDFQISSLPRALNDSGCLLGDNDVFDAQLEDDTNDVVMEEEESLNAIRDAVKQKAKHKVRAVAHIPEATSVGKDLKI